MLVLCVDVYEGALVAATVAVAAGAAAASFASDCLKR